MAQATGNAFDQIADGGLADAEVMAGGTVNAARSVADLCRALIDLAILMEWIERAYVEVDDALLVLFGYGWRVGCVASAFVIACDLEVLGLGLLLHGVSRSDRILNFILDVLKPGADLAERLPDRQTKVSWKGADQCAENWGKRKFETIDLRVDSSYQQRRSQFWSGGDSFDE